MGAGDDLTLRSVIEAVLDAKGFEEFKAKLEESADKAKKSGQAVNESGAHFEKLGRRLPHAAFDILSREMLRNLGVQGQLGPIARVSTVAMESLAASAGLVGGAMAGVTFGLSLLLPILLSLGSKTKDVDEQTIKVAEDTDALIGIYEGLRKKGVELTRVQQEYYEVLVRIREEERAKQLKSIEDEIDAQQQLINSTEGLWGKTKLLAKGIFETVNVYQGMAVAEENRNRILGQARTEMDRLIAKLNALREAQEKGFKSATEFGQGELDAADKAREAAKRSEEAAKRVAEARAQISSKAAADIAQQEVEAAENTFDRITAIRRHEEVLLAEQLRQAERAGATYVELDELRAASHARMMNRIRLEDRKYEKDRDRQIKEGIEKNHDEAAAIIDAIALEREEERRRHEEKLQHRIQEADAAIAGLSAGIAFAELVFGKNKSLAIAQAIIDTYGAANRALNTPPGPPYTIPFMLLAIAQGLANVKRIKESQAGGFDVPSSDAMVAQAFRKFGDRWAADMTRIAVGSAEAGFSSGLSRRMGGSTIHQSTRIDRGTHIGTANFNGLLGTPRQAMLDLHRMQINAGRVEDRTRRRSA